MAFERRKEDNLHGGDIYRNQVTLDFSVNTNPFGVPEGVLSALTKAVAKSNTYPDPLAEDLTEAVAEWGGYKEDMLVFGNGASELFPAILRAVRPSKILIPVPSFFGYERAAEQTEIPVTYIPMREEDDYALQEEFLTHLTGEGELVFLANPNNPVGNRVDTELLEQIAAVCLKKQTTLVIDECFLELSGAKKEDSFAGKLEQYPNVIVIRAFTKLFAIPGVRLGYLVCEKQLAGKIRNQLPEWNLSVFAQEAGIACTKEQQYVVLSVAEVAKERAYLKTELERLHFHVFPSEANFLLFHADTKRNLYEKLLERGILIRDCKNFRGLKPGCYRIAVKTAEENRQLIAALSKLCEGEEKIQTDQTKRVAHPTLEYVLPTEIEHRSFAIITEELLARNITIHRETEKVVKRVIHTSADFSYADTMKFSDHAVLVAQQLISQGADIVTDTNMALAGINKKKLAAYGGSVHCFMADEQVAKEAKERGMTRAAVSMEHAAALEKPVIFAVGNAPTALVKLYEMIEEKSFTPAFIIGVPVGFVNVEAAKEMILKTDVPYIINRGRKGGSNIAAAICNALLYDME